MVRKLAEDAFTFYVALGPERSYESVAKHYHATKRAVTKAAAREQWSKRLEAIERKTREMTDAKLADSLHERDMRHRKMLLAMASRAAAAIQAHPLTDGMQGVKTAEIVIKLERLLTGDAGENTTLTLQRVVQEEHARFLTTQPECDDEWDDNNDDEDAAPPEQA